MSPARSASTRWCIVVLVLGQEPQESAVDLAAGDQMLVLLGIRDGSR